MTIIKFQAKDEALAAILRALADKVAGHQIVSGQTDAVLHEKGFYEFAFADHFQEKQFKGYVERYLRNEDRATLEITADCKDPFAEF